MNPTKPVEPIAGHTCEKGFVTPIDQPKPVSHVMPEAVNELLMSMEGFSDTLSVSASAVRAAPHIKAAYARIAELKEDLGDYKLKGPHWTCVDCGYDGEGFETIKNEGDPSLGYDYDMVCPECSNKDIRESPSEVINHLLDKQHNIESQLSTLKAQTKEVIKAGDSVKSQLQQEEPNCFQGMIDNWKYVTAALRQSGQGSTE